VQTYSCKMCNKKFTSRLTLEKHQKSHSVYWCKDCNYEFCSRLNLQLSAGNIGTPAYVCELCGISVSSAGKLRGHVTRFHWRQKPYSCDQCADVTASCDDVQQMPYECLVCKLSFTAYVYLKQHLKHHSKNKAYLCNTCNTQFLTLAMFKSHLATHTGEKSVTLKTYKRKSK
jgi:KRAB domain-containing zinc finger protein